MRCDVVIALSVARDDSMEVSLCPAVTQHCDFGHVTALAVEAWFAYDIVVVLVEQPADHRLLELACVKGRDHAVQLKLVDDGEVLASTAILAGRLEQVEFTGPQSSAQPLRGREHGGGWTARH